MLITAIIIIMAWNIMITAYLLAGNCLPAILGIPMMIITIVTFIIIKYLNAGNKK